MSKYTAEEMVFQPLQLGDEGSMVLIVQKTLNSIGYEVVANGIFDTIMDAKVRKFQTERDLVVDGIVGARMMVEIDNIFLET